MTLTELLAYSLFHGPAPTGAVSVSDAKSQGVVALVHDALLALQEQGHEVPVSRQEMFMAAMLTDGVERSNRRREEMLRTFAARLKREKGIDTVVVKGSSLARHYPVPLHRECGDNDIYLGPRAHEADAWLRDMGVAVDDSDPRHSSFILNGIAFENHAYLMYPRRPGDATCDPAWQTEQIGEGLHVLTPPYEALFTAAHAEHHAVFHNECVGLRQVVEWARLLPHLDYEAYNALKRDRFGDLLTQYCVATFRLEPPRGWRPLSERALTDFPAIYLVEQPRSKHALVRVFRRSMKYIRYRHTYREVYGESPFRRFYLRNLTQAIHQVLTGHQRAEGRQ